MGKSSKAQRLSYAQPATPKKAWCDHCLDTLHDGNLSDGIGEQLIETYVNMRDAEYNHVGAMAGIEAEVGIIIQALRSSGEQYHRDGEIEYGDGAASEEEYNAWEARREAREARRAKEAS